MLITANGIVIRTGLEEIRAIGRNTQGVRLIKIAEGDKLVAAEKILAETAEAQQETAPQNNEGQDESQTEPGSENDKGQDNSQTEPDSEPQDEV
jgi:DNA gyrase subunit A